ncbi:MAG: SpoIID/LytB domain-containing protein [Coleofasciculaceae cyanobacterium RL_1_1]|nr:SpoIID/LytB domain-containing protein [Coleofasciculaceae cyanobacterium RL_1_1]
MKYKSKPAIAISALLIGFTLSAQLTARTYQQRAIAQTATPIVPNSADPADPAQPSPNQPFDDRIHVGIIQRFGENPQDRLILRDANGGSLRVSFERNGQRETRNLDAIAIELDEVAAEPPIIDDRVVLSVHRSYENAEASAREWQARGIATEIAQPDRWEVWADRQVYDSPLLRQLLFDSTTAADLTETLHVQGQRDRRQQLAWKILGETVRGDAMTIEPSSGAAKIEHGVTQPDRYTYGGTFYLQPNAYGTYTLVNHVSIETYLRGVVPYEIGTGAPYAAIEAQAIIARTYALRNLHRFAIDDYELCADTHCQAYWGLTGSTATTDRAIAATAGQVLAYNNEPIDALYSSTTGGFTAPFEDVWQGKSRPYLQAILDSVEVSWDLDAKPLSDEANFRQFIALEKQFNESDWDTFRWREQTSLKEMTAYFKRYLQRSGRPIGFNAITAVEITERSRAGRVLAMRVTTDTGEMIIPGDEIRSAFYPPISTFFYVNLINEPPNTNPSPTTTRQQSPNPTPTPTSTAATPKIPWGYEFIGGGFGHGVGLSQTGAYNLANIGKNSTEILEFYYPGVGLTQIETLQLDRLDRREE